MLVYSFIFLFYSLGTYLAITHDGSELSLWFLAFGLVLDIAMLFFDWIGAKYAPRLGEGDLAAKLLRVLSFFFFCLAFFLRILPKIKSFKLIIGIAIGVWIIFFARSLLLHFRKKRSK